MSTKVESIEPVHKKLKINNVTENDNIDACMDQSNNVEFDNDIFHKINVKNPGETKSYDESKGSEQCVDIHDEKNVLVLDDDNNTYVFPPDDDITDMLTEVAVHAKFPTVTQRYLIAYYRVNVQRPGDDICIWVHSNRICMLSLAPSHLIFGQHKKILKVDFKVSEKLDRASNKVSGKSKHGAQPLQTDSNICTISCDDGETHMIKCCMIGKLVEVNKMLLESPDLLRLPPHKGGYLAIVLPNIKLLDKLKETMLTEEQYESLMSMQLPLKH